MSAPSTLATTHPRAGFVPILLANLLPLVGVLAFGWDASTLAMVYALEVFLSFPLAAVKALFAQQPSKVETDENDHKGPTVADELKERRGSAQLVPWLPPVYPRNVPFVSTVFTGFAWVAVAVGSILATAIPVADVLTRPEVLVSIFALVAASAADGWFDYIGGGRYEAVSAYEVAETHVGQTLFVVFVLMVVTIPEDVSGVALLVGFVAAKVLVEWASFRAAHRDGGPNRILGWLAGPDDPTEPTEPPIVPDGEPAARFATDDTAVRYTAVQHTLFRSLFLAPWIVISWVVLLAVFTGDGTPLSVVVGTAVAFGSLLLLQPAVEFLKFVLRYGPLEYRRYEDDDRDDDRLVAYDTWVDEPQWSVPLHEVRDVTVVRDNLPDHLLDTRTFAATIGWGDDKFERDLGPVSDGEAFATTFDLLVRSTDLEPIDRRLAGAAVALAGCAVLGFVLAVAATPSVGTVIQGVYILPFALVPSWGLWRLAYPSAE